MEWLLLHDAPEIFKKLGRTIRQWFEPIIRMWRFSKSNGITEGFHRKMKLMLQGWTMGFYPPPAALRASRAEVSARRRVDSCHRHSPPTPKPPTAVRGIGQTR